FEDEKIKMRIIRTFFFEIKQLKNCISFVKEYENEVKKYVIIDLNNYVCEKVKNCSDNAEYILKNISHELLNKETIDFIGNIFIENTKDIKSLDFFIDKIKQSEKLTTSYEYLIRQNPNQSGNP
ncbi:MAG: hypothetical protein WC002_10380, partial [Candidatus Muiribacteriota bacterium]